jgi:hypothetical protein
MSGTRRRHKASKGDDGLTIITQNSYGYSDIIRTMSYARSIKYILGKKISVKYVVSSDKENYAWPDSFEYEQNIYDVLDNYSDCIQYEVEICELEKYAHKYVNFLRKENADIVAKKIGYPKLVTKEKPLDHKYLCVWTPWNNLAPVEHDKMPINKDTLDSYINTLDIPVKIVHYRMSIDYVFETIRNSTLCLGYEGLGQQIAYHYNKKLVTLSNWKQVSKNTGGPDSLICNDLKKVDKYVNLCFR